MRIKQMYSKIRTSWLSAKTGLTACAAVLGISLMASTASAGFIQIIEFEIEDGTYYPGDPVPMSMTVINASPDSVSNPIRADVHLTHGGQFRRPDPITDHVLAHLNGPVLAPGETFQWRWVQRMPGNLPGNFIVDAESYTGDGPNTTANGWTLSNENPSMIETAKITLMPEEHPETEIVSVTEENQGAQGLSGTPSISANGRWVTFASEAQNLVGSDPDDDENEDEDDVSGPSERVANIFVRDQWTGEVNRISTPLGAEVLDSPAFRPRISRDAANPDQDGRWIVFHTAATNIVSGITNSHNDVYLKDRQTGELTRVSLAHDRNTQANQASQNASVSGDGRFVVFESEATNLLPGDNLDVTGGFAHIYIYDTEHETLSRIGANTGGPLRGGHSRNPRISADGQNVVFESRATNLANETSNVWEIYVYDRETNRTTRLSAGFDELGEEILADGHSRSPDISADGKFVAFHSEATNLFGDPAVGEIFLTGRPAEGLLEFTENEPGSATITLDDDSLATGLIHFDGTPTDGDTVQIDDGDQVSTFEFDGPFPNGVEDGNVQVIIGTEDDPDYPALTRTNLGRAINDEFVVDDRNTIVASETEDAGQPALALTNFAFGESEANQPIVADSSSLHVEGMDGAGSVESPSPGDVVEIENGRLPPVYVEFYATGGSDPSDVDARVIGVEIGSTNKETSLNMLQAFHDLGYHQYDGFMVPEIPEKLLPPEMENPRHGESFTLRRGNPDAQPGDEDAFQEQTFFFTNQDPQVDPGDLAHIRIEETPEGTRGNLMRAIASFFQFDELPAQLDSTGDAVAFSELFGDGAAQGAVRLIQMPEDGHEIRISDGELTTTFRFEEEREQTEEEEEQDIPVPPFEVIGAGLVRVYLFEDEDTPLADMEDRFAESIQASALNLSVGRGFNGDLEANAILLLNNEVGEFGNVPIEIDPLDDDGGDDDDENGEEEEDENLVETEWASSYGMTGGFSESVSDGERIVFYPENLLHPTVVFEFSSNPAEVSPDAVGVQIGSTGSETEGNFLAALYASGLPWLWSEEPDEDSPSVRLTSKLAAGSGEIAFTLSATDPDPFDFSTMSGQARTPRHGGTVTLNDGENEVTFEFSVDGTVYDDGENEPNVPVQIATTTAISRDNLVQAINTAEAEDHLNITAEAAAVGGEPSITLSHTEPGPDGNQPITLANIGPDVDKADMKGGQWNPAEGEGFEIQDGANEPITFEFVHNEGNVSDSAFHPVVIGDDAGRIDTRDNIEQAIKDSGLRIDVGGTFERNGNPGLYLQNQVPGPVGNLPISIFADRPSFTVFGMSGGSNGGPGFEQVYLVNRDSNNNGVFDEQGHVAVELVSINEAGEAANNRSLEPSVSDDGRYVAYRSEANDLLPRTVVRSDGTPFPSIPDTRQYVFGEAEDSLVGIWDATQEIQNWTDADSYSDIYVYDGQEDEQVRASVNRFGEAYVGFTGTRRHPYSDRGATMSADGRFIAFESNQEPYSSAPSGGSVDGDGLQKGGGLWHGATNRDILDRNSWQDVFIHDRKFPTDSPPPEGSVTLHPLPDWMTAVTVGSVDGTPTGSSVPIRVSATPPDGAVVEEIEIRANNETIAVMSSPPYRFDWIPEETGHFMLSARMRASKDGFEREWISDSVDITVKPLGVVINDPSNPANSLDFITQTYFDLLGPQRAPTAAELGEFASGLAENEWTRAEIIAKMVTLREFEQRGASWVVAAYLTVLRELPTVEQLEDGIELLNSGEGDDEVDLPDDVDFETLGNLPLLVFDILDSFEFEVKYSESGLDMSESRLVDVVHPSETTHTVTQERITEMEELGRLLYLTDLTARRLESKSFERETLKTVMVLLLLRPEAEVSREEIAALPSSLEDAADVIVTRWEFRNRFGYRAPVFGPFAENGILGTKDSDSGLLVKTSWFGKFNDYHFDYTLEEGWLKHTEHGWVYIANDRGEGNSMWFWEDFQRDWLWTTRAIYLESEDSNGRVLFSDDRQLWIHIPPFPEEEKPKPDSRKIRVHQNGEWSPKTPLEPRS